MGATGARTRSSPGPQFDRVRPRTAGRSRRRRCRGGRQGRARCPANRAKRAGPAPCTRVHRVPPATVARSVANERSPAVLWRTAAVVPPSRREVILVSSPARCRPGSAARTASPRRPTNPRTGGPGRATAGFTPAPSVRSVVRWHRDGPPRRPPRPGIAPSTCRTTRKATGTCAPPSRRRPPFASWASSPHVDAGRTTVVGRGRAQPVRLTPARLTPARLIPAP